MRSFVARLYEHFCGVKPDLPNSGLMTMGVLARACGEHMAHLEQEVTGGSPNEFILTKISQVSRAAFMWSVDAISVAEMEKWISDYNQAPQEDREPDPVIKWEDPYVATEFDNGPRLAKEVWLLHHPAITLQLYMATFDLNRRDASEELQVMRWNPTQESVNGHVMSVWRWNPYKWSRPRGATPGRSVVLPGISPAEFTAQQFKQFLDHLFVSKVTEISMSDLALRYFRTTVTNQKKLQNIRNLMRSFGWEYHHPSKTWRVTSLYRQTYHL